MSSGLTLKTMHSNDLTQNVHNDTSIIADNTTPSPCAIAFCNKWFIKNIWLCINMLQISSAGPHIRRYGQYMINPPLTHWSLRDVAVKSLNLFMLQFRPWTPHINHQEKQITIFLQNVVYALKSLFVICTYSSTNYISIADQNDFKLGMFRSTESMLFPVRFLNQGTTNIIWWRHQMEIFSALLAICVGNSPVPGEFPTQRPVTRSFDVFFDLRLNKRLSKQS